MIGKMLAISGRCVHSAGTFLVAFCMIAFSLAPAQAQRLPLVRDAEIEGLMRLYTRPIFETAGINPASVDVHLINSPQINAFVAGGQRIFINTGLLEQADTPNEVIGVLAHETAHIAGGHLARLGIQVDRMSTAAIIGTLLGVAAVAGAAATGQRGAAQAGQGILMGTQGLTQRSMMAYARVQESAADQAAVRYLDSTGQSARGMLSLFQKLANKSLASTRYVDPYVLSHPMPLERIRNLERLAKQSPNYNRKDPPALVVRHKLAQAKLAGFLRSPRAVYRKYPTSDSSIYARYARAIAAFRTGDTANAVRTIDGLIKELPQNPYFWELKGQALLEGGQPAQAVAPLKKAASMLPSNGLIRIMLAQAQINAGAPRDALQALRRAQRSENDAVALHRLKARAYAQLKNIPMAELSTAEAALLSGDRELAKEKADAAQKRLKSGTPEWHKANDILNYAKRK